MKKIVSILLIVAFIIVSFLNFSNAVDASVAVTVGGPTSIEEGTKTLELTIDLGAFSNFEEGKTLGYETVLSYNTDAIESVAVVPLNNWTADYNTTTKKIIGTVTAGQANKSIAKVTYTLKDNVPANTDLRIEFKSFNITDDDTLDLTLNLTKSITINQKQVSNPTTTPSTSTETPSTTNGNTQNNNIITLNPNTSSSTQNKNVTLNVSTNTTKKDNTVTAKNTLPKTGISQVIIPVIFMILVLGIASIIKSKSIKLK